MLRYGVGMKGRVGGIRSPLTVMMFTYIFPQIPTHNRKFLSRG